MTVVAPLKLHEHVTTRVASGQSNGAHHGLGAGGNEPNLVHVGKALFDSFGEFNLAEVGGSKRRPFQHFFVNRPDDVGVGVAVNQGAP